VLPGTRPVDIEPYALFMFTGILPWTWFSSSLLESSNVLISGGNLIKKVLFPAEVLPIVTALANMVHFFLGLPILAPSWSTTASRCRSPSSSGSPWSCSCSCCSSWGIGLIVSALTVHFRDVKDILSNLVTFWFFATPIIYPMSAVPAEGRWLLNLNPFTHLAISYQEILFYDGPFGHWKWLLALLVASVGLFLFGYFVFDRLRDSFAEAV
jgi:lipopolysaccharide transport system permease protein